MSESHAPRHVRSPGDIVIYEHDHAAGTCLLSAFQRANQLTFRTYEDAISDAEAFAARKHVDAWYTFDGETYQRTAQHRRVSPDALMVGRVP